MKTTLIALVSIFLFAFSCNGDKTEKEQLNSLEKEALEVTKEAGLKAEDFKDKIDELLTLEMAAQASGLPETEATKKHNTTVMESVKYEWKSDRTKKLEVSKGNFMDIPLKNVIELSWVKNTTLQQFKHDYHNPTAEELKNAEIAMDKKANELNAEGKASKEQTDAANNIAKNSISKFKVEEVPNLGDYAVFVNSGIMGVSTRDLKVFYKELSFTLEVDLSDNAADNDKKAIETAKMIINQKLK
jgi:coenzyme F420-reducing hydrogenase alpha subunit